MSHLRVPSPQPPCWSCHLGPSEGPLLQDKLPYRGGGSPGHTISHSHGFSELGYKGASLIADTATLWSCQSSECFISHTSRPFIFCPRNTKFFKVGVLSLTPRGAPRVLMNHTCNIPWLCVSVCLFVCLSDGTATSWSESVPPFLFLFEGQSSWKAIKFKAL